MLKNIETLETRGFEIEHFRKLQFVLSLVSGFDLGNDLQTRILINIPEIFQIDLDQISLFPSIPR